MTDKTQPSSTPSLVLRRRPPTSNGSSSTTTSTTVTMPSQHKRRQRRVGTTQKWWLPWLVVTLAVFWLVLVWCGSILVQMSSMERNNTTATAVSSSALQTVPRMKSKSKVSYQIIRAKDREASVGKFKYPLLSIRDIIMSHKGGNEKQTTHKEKAEIEKNQQGKKRDCTLKAYLEPIYQDDWETKPLPVRNTTKHDLKVMEYPQVTSCSKLTQQFPVDEYPSDDPFLPWIHDVFPTHDGKYIQFVAQNKRRCNTGHYKASDKAILRHYQPQAALFQHVPIKRILSKNNTTRYKLTSHEFADKNGVATRFICRFHPSLEETLSIYNVNYEYAAFRKGNRQVFTKQGYDLHSIYTSQLLFQCPVPLSLVDLVKSGESVVNDKATLFVDVVPIRTPPRYGPPNAFFPPRYQQHAAETTKFNASEEWGDQHILPDIVDSGRWEHVPICKPSLHTHQPQLVQTQTQEASSGNATTDDTSRPTKHHRLIACVWASASYTTRGERFRIQDGPRRLYEWLTFNFATGFDHIYVYDNSGAHSTNLTLAHVTDQFPTKTTRIPWPYQVCNNRPNNVDNPGERSSQYAAEASCQLRFGPHTTWLGGFDLDEYLIPLQNHSSVLNILDTLEKEQKKIISFSSWRAWPRKTMIEKPKIIRDKDTCGSNKPCFHLRVPANHTYLQTYNCDRQQGPKKSVMPAEKQLYQPDYVKLHFVHYSAITELAQLSKSETLARGWKWTPRIHADPASRFSDEVNEATMLHTKAVATKDTTGWLEACREGHSRMTCRVGNPYPPGAYQTNMTVDQEGWLYNCFVNEHIENYWVPRLIAKNPFYESD